VLDTKEENFTRLPNRDDSYSHDPWGALESHSDLQYLKQASNSREFDEEIEDIEESLENG